ncbi:MAG: hypothetical protein LBQ36_06650 [Synergistaceae bacterium]|nr:hypothetical protein [Synergistaceae bacterium]
MKFPTRRLVAIILISAAVMLLYAGRTPVQAFPFTTVYIKRPNTFYHRRSCLALRQGGGVTAISVSNAKERGFRPCRRCEPPTW